MSPNPKSHFDNIDTTDNDRTEAELELFTENLQTSI